MPLLNARQKARFAALCRREGSHRIAYELVHVPAPRRLYVLHGWNKQPCVNVEHLELGTQKENIAQAVERKRHRNARKITCKRGTQRFASLIAIKPKGGTATGGAADWQHKDGEGQGRNHVLAHHKPPKKRSRNFKFSQYQR